MVNYAKSGWIFGFCNNGAFLNRCWLTTKSRIAGVYPWWKIVATSRPVRIAQTVLCCRSGDRPFTCPIPYSEGHLFHGQGPLVILYTQITVTYNAKQYTPTTNVLLYFMKWQTVREPRSLQNVIGCRKFHFFILILRQFGSWRLCAFIAG
jgi:hypothetical protein